jgi:hypothetical protein
MPSVAVAVSTAAHTSSFSIRLYRENKLCRRAKGLAYSTMTSYTFPASLVIMSPSPAGRRYGYGAAVTRATARRLETVAGALIAQF